MANDITKVYQFLGTLGDWKSKMDKNGDGTIIKYEFRQFMNNDFEWDGTPTDSEKNSLIDQFWSKFDTNTKNGRISGTSYRNKNALSNDELSNMQETIGVYENLNTYVGKLKAPTGLDSTKWKESVTASLSDLTEKFIKQGGKADNLETYLDSQIQNIEAKTTTDYYALSVSDKYKSQLDNYELYNDTTFKSFIDAYIEAKINNVTDDDALPSVTDIKAEIDKIAEAYIATAELDGDASNLEIEPYNYKQENTDALNDLQKSKIKTAATSILEAAVKAETDYNSYKDAYDSALNEFIDDALKSLTLSDYNEYLTNTTNLPDAISLTTFKESSACKNISNTITINNIVNNIDENSDLYKQLSATYGDDLANRVKNDGKYLNVMQEIKNSVVEKMKNGDYDTNGEFDTEKLIKDLASQIGSKMSSFYTNGFGDLGLEDLNKVYESFVKAAESETDTDVELQQRRNAAVMYCDALSSKSSYKSAVTEVFGTNYKTAIEKMLPTEINEKIEKLQSLAADVITIENMTEAEKNALIAGIKDSYSFEQNAIDNKIQLPNSATCKGQTITTDRISYSGSGCVTINESGNVTIDTTKAGTYSGKINILVDGNVVATKTITVTVKEAASEIVAKITDKELSLRENVDDWNADANFKDLYNEDRTVILYGRMDTRKKDWNHMKDRIKTDLSNLGSQVVDVLVTAGLDKSKLETATQTVVNRYMDAGAIRYKNNSGTSRQALIDHGNNYMTENRNNTASRIVWTVDTDGKDSNVYMIHFKDFVDDIIAEYKKL